MRQVDAQLQEIGDALVALALEVVLSHPEGVVAGPVHELSDGLGLVEHGREPLVGEPPVVDRGRVEADVVQVHMARVQAAKLGDHAQPLISVILAGADG